MNDKFLYELRQQPDAAFAKDLHRRLKQNHPEPEWRKKAGFHNLLGRKRLVQVASFLVVSTILVMVITPARAFVSSLITSIAGQLFQVTEDYPGDNYPGGEEIIEPQVMSLGDALAVFPYSIHMPTNMPSGYILNKDNVRVYLGDQAGPFADTIEFEWLSGTHAKLFLMITDMDRGISEVIGPDSSEEVLLDDDHAAVLISGMWDSDNKVWNSEHGFRLRWSVDNLLYELMGTDREQLIKIAISTLE